MIYMILQSSQITCVYLKNLIYNTIIINLTMEKEYKIISYQNYLICKTPHCGQYILFLISGYISHHTWTVVSQTIGFT